MPDQQFAMVHWEPRWNDAGQVYTAPYLQSGGWMLHTIGALGVVYIDAQDVKHLAAQLRMWADAMEKSVAAVGAD